MNIYSNQPKEIFKRFEQNLSSYQPSVVLVDSQSFTKNIEYDYESDEKHTKLNLFVGLTTALGVFLPYILQKKLLVGKEANSTLLGLASTALGAIFGALSGAALTNSKHFKEKIKDSVYLFSTIMIPSVLTSVCLNLIKPGNKFKGVVPTFASTMLGVLIGMPLACEFTKKINNAFIKNAKNDNRKLHLNDYMVHFDDILVGLTLGKATFLNRIHADKLIPVIFGYFGYKIGAKD